MPRAEQSHQKYLVTERLSPGTEPADKISAVPTAASPWIHMKNEKEKTTQNKPKPNHKPKEKKKKEKSVLDN